MGATINYLDASSEQLGIMLIEEMAICQHTVMQNANNTLCRIYYNMYV